jgi:thiol-disulfide isomerase/thioredoxin
MENLTSIQEYEQLIQEKVVFVFTANWCPDCFVIKPFLPKPIEQFSQYQWIYINRDHFPELATRLDVFGIPSFIVFENGVEKGRFVSKNRKTKSEIEQFMNQVVGGDVSEK